MSPRPPCPLAVLAALSVWRTTLAGRLVRAPFPVSSCVLSRRADRSRLQGFAPLGESVATRCRFQQLVARFFHGLVYLTATRLSLRRAPAGPPLTPEGVCAGSGLPPLVQVALALRGRPPGSFTPKSVIPRRWLFSLLCFQRRSLRQELASGRLQSAMSTSKNVPSVFLG